MKREVDIARRLLESKGYNVSKKLRESASEKEELEKMREGIGTGARRVYNLVNFPSNEPIYNRDTGNMYQFSSEEEANKFIKEHPYIKDRYPSVQVQGRTAYNVYHESKKMTESFDKSILPDGVSVFRDFGGKAIMLKGSIDTIGEKFRSAGWKIDRSRNDIGQLGFTKDGKSILLSCGENPGITYIRESKKMNESAEEHAGWDYWEMTKDYRGPWDAKQYQKEYNNELYLTIYPPQDVPGDGYQDDWAADIQGINSGTSIDSYEDGFNSFEEAEEWINSQIQKYDPEGDATARYEESLQDAIDKLDKLIKSVPADIMSDFKDKAIKIIQSYK